MSNSFLLSSLRNMRRNATFSLLNIGSLAVGLAACIVIFLFVNYESGFDNQHDKKDRIYRILETQKFDGTPEQEVALSMFPMAPALQRDYPEIESSVRVDQYHFQNVTVRNGVKQISIPEILVADSSFFEIFDFPLISGNAGTVLKEADQVVVTEGTARKLFGRTDITGETIEVYKDGSFKPFSVSGVAKDVPGNSHIQFDGVLSFHSLQIKDWMTSWDANWVITYLVLSKHSTTSTLEKAMPAFLAKYAGAEANNHYQVHLQPLNQVHLGSSSITHDNLNYKKFSKSYVQIFSIIAIFVLLVAVLNFINLSTARAASRAKEVGIRKTIGASRSRLILQFTGEAVLFSIVATIAAAGIVWLSLPLVRHVTDRPITFDIFNKVWLLLSILGLAVVTGIAAGIYPAFILSSFKPVKVLKGVLSKSPKNGWVLRNALVIAQFSIAVVLIVSTITIGEQLRYISNKDIGFDKDYVITVGMNETANKNFETLKTELLKNPQIVGITGYNERLGSNVAQMGADYLSESGEKKHLSLSHLAVDYDYLPLFNIKFVAGRNFDRSHDDTKGHSYIINETLARQLDRKNPIGTPYSASWLKDMGHVIGVVKDFNFNSLHSKVAPIYISMMDWDYSEAAIKLKAGSTPTDINFIKTRWAELVPDMPFNYTFLDEHLKGLYANDRRAGTVITSLTCLALLVAGVGLFGIALFATQTRVKEIGIRKVLGATASSITTLFTKDFMKPVFVSFLISIPFAWWAMNQWLEGFAYRIHLSWLVLGAAVSAACILALITISVQTIRAALANPINSLRNQ